MSSKRFDSFIDSPHTRSIASTSRNSSRMQTGAIGFLSPLDLNIFQKRLCFYVSSVRSRQWKWRRLLRVFNIVTPVFIVAISLSPDVKHRDRMLFTIIRFLLPLTYIGANTTMVISASVALAGLIIFALAWLALELLLNTNGRPLRRISLLDTLLRVLAGPLLVPCSQLLAAPLLKDGAELADLVALDFAWYFVTIASVLCRLALGVLAVFTVLVRLAHFSETVSSTSLRFVDFPTKTIFIVPLLAEAVAVVQTTAAAGLGLSIGPLIPACVICILSIASTALLVAIPPHAGLLRWGTAVWLALLPAMVAVTSVMGTSLAILGVAFAVVGAVILCGLKILILLALFKRYSEPPVDVLGLSRVSSGVLKQDSRTQTQSMTSGIIPLEHDDMPPDIGIVSLMQFVFLQVQFRGLFRAKIKHNTDRFDMLSVTSPTVRADKTRAGLIAQLFRLTQLAAARTRSASGRIHQILFSIHVDSSHDAALFDIWRTPRLIQRGALRALGFAELGMLVAVRCEANRLKQRQETGFTSDELTELHNKERQAKVLAQGARRSIHQFWKTLDSKNPRAEDLARVAENIYAQSSQADHLFIEVLRAFPHRVHLIKHYAEFLANVKQEADIAEKLREIADQISAENRNETIHSPRDDSDGESLAQSTIHNAQTVGQVLSVHGAAIQSSTIRRLKLSACTLMVTLGILFVAATLCFHVLNLLLSRMMALQYSAAEASVAAARASFLATTSVGDAGSFSTELSVNSAVDSFDSSLDGLSAVDITVIGVIASDVFSKLNDAWTMSADYTGDIPDILQYSRVSPVAFGQSLVIMLRAAATGDLTAAKISVINITRQFRLTLDRVLDSIAEALDTIWYTSAVIFLVIWIVSMAILVILQIFLMKRSFNYVRKFQERNYNIFLHIPGRLIRQMVSSTTIKAKKRQGASYLNRQALSNRRIISFKEPHDATQISMFSLGRYEGGAASHEDLTAEVTVEGDGPTTLDTVSTATDEIGKFSSDEDDDEGEALRMNQEKAIDILDNPVLTLEVNPLEGVDLAEVARTLAKQHGSLRLRLRFIWVALILMLVMGISLLCLLVGASIVLVTLYPQLTSSFTTANDIVTRLEHLQDLVDQRTWSAMRFAQGPYLDAESIHWAVRDAREDVTEAIELSVESHSIQDNLLAALNAESAAEYIETNSVLLARSAWGYNLGTRCQLTDYSYDITTETTYSSDHTTYYTERAQYGYYSDSAADLELDSDTKSSIAQAVMADSKYWKFKDTSADAIDDVKSYLLDRSKSEVESLVTEQSIVLTVQNNSLRILLGLRVVATTVLIVALLINVRLKVIDFRRLDVLREMYRMSSESAQLDDPMHTDTGMSSATTSASNLSLRSSVSRASAASAASITSRGSKHSVSLSIGSLMRSASEVTCVDGDGDTNAGFVRKMRTLSQNLFLNVIAMIVVMFCISIALNSIALAIAENIATMTLEANDNNQIKHDYLRDTSDFHTTVRQTLKTARLFAQRFKTADLYTLKSILAEDPTLFVNNYEVDDDFAATAESLQRSWADVVHIVRVSAQLGIWAASIPDSVAGSMDGYAFNITAETGSAHLSILYPDRMVYSNTASDEILSRGEQAALARSLLFDAYFAELVDSIYDCSNKLSTELSSVIDTAVTDTWSRTIVQIFLFLVFLASILGTYYMFCRSVLKIATPPALQSINVVRQQVSLLRLRRFEQISTGTLTGIAFLFTAFVSYTLIVYLPITQSAAIPIEGARAADVFNAASLLVGVASSPTTSTSDYARVTSRVREIDRAAISLSDSNTLALFADAFPDRSDDREISSPIECGGTTPREALAVFKNAVSSLDPDFGSCVCVDGTQSADFANALGVAQALAELYSSNMASLHRLVQAVHYVYWVGQAPILVICLVSLIVVYRLAFVPIFRRLSDDEAMVRGLLTMIPKDQVVPDTLLGDFLGVEKR
ncbi:hypothetical protein J8273_1130 [Carpediemonas membranifera]|uniref:TmcB/TmcC TPR repeats domain-containing protein n=1 Tax=Carpediemonas membranifera TaxID=201153 RepID=A0A8J6B1D8_9EUKA|nr:hypothetical protein J8273_1130 [Carpediemonas membranifera]|eukprot:KAG9397220.1 hypothetical protein J8273_1130 [Carpediemonas membranifera]